VLAPATVPVWTPPPVPVDREEIERTLRLLWAPGQVGEIRALNVSTREYRQPHTASGYYDDPAKAAQAAAELSQYATGIYCTLNPVNPALLARAYNRWRHVTGKDPLTSDGDVERRRWLLVDLDPTRPSGISASEAEKEAALDRARDVRRHLQAEGWPDPIAGDSGNGAHLLYRVDIPAKDEGLVQRVLEGLAGRFDDGRVTVDTTVFNPARITKVYGTRVCKGDHTPSRPHRQARLLHVPEILQ